MPHIDVGHKFLDVLEHIWPYISGVCVTILAYIRWRWHVHKELKKEVHDNAAAIVAINRTMVTKEDLQACREEVRDTDDKNLDLIFGEIRQISRENAQQHQDIMSQIVRLHSAKENRG